MNWSTRTTKNNEVAAMKFVMRLEQNVLYIKKWYLAPEMFENITIATSNVINIIQIKHLSRKEIIFLHVTKRLPII